MENSYKRIFECRQIISFEAEMKELGLNATWRPARWNNDSKLIFVIEGPANESKKIDRLVSKYDTH